MHLPLQLMAIKEGDGVCGGDFGRPCEEPFALQGSLGFRAPYIRKTHELSWVICRLSALEEGRAILLAEIADLRVRLQEVREGAAADAAAQQQAAAAASSCADLRCAMCSSLHQPTETEHDQFHRIRPCMIDTQRQLVVRLIVPLQ